MGDPTEVERARRLERPTLGRFGVVSRVTVSRAQAALGAKIVLLVVLIAVAVGAAAVRHTSTDATTVSAPLATTEGVGALVGEGVHRDVRLGGQDWATSVSAELFHPARAFDPGEVRTAVLLVRNDDTTPHDLVMGLARGVTADDTGGRLEIAVQVGRGAWTDLDLTSSAQQQVPIGAMGPHARRAVRLRATVDPAAGTPLTVSAADLTFAVTVAGDVPTTDVPPATPSASAHLLLAPVFLLVAALGVFGLLLLGRRRGRQDASAGS